jgi:hypothetical protein
VAEDVPIEAHHVAGSDRAHPEGKHVFIGSGAAEPAGLVEQMVADEIRFADNTVVHLMTLGPAP